MSRFEDADKTLKQKKSLLRLGQDKKSTLAFKSTPPEISKKFKMLNELEVIVSDFNTMRLILKALGYRPEQTYEKWRETFNLRFGLEDDEDHRWLNRKKSAA